MSDGQSSPRRLLLLTFRLDVDQRQRLKARLAADGRTMSEVITNGLRQYVQHPRRNDEPAALPDGGAALPDGIAATSEGSGARPVLPGATAARLRELRLSGRSGVLSATLAALHDDGWPLPAYPRRRQASKGGLRPHLTIKIDHGLRADAHRAAAGEGRSLSQVVETILDKYLRHGADD
jgi:antitoxin component of RelBE/YafQ-DinJ toxin-antitoxin module